MIGFDNKMLRNVRNDANDLIRIKEYFIKYPNSKPKECCRLLRVDYKKHSNKVRKIKHDLKKKGLLVNNVTEDGRVLDPHNSIHRVEYILKESVPATYVTFLEEKASHKKIEGSWYRSTNPNKQLIYSNANVGIQLHQNGTCRIFPRRKMTNEALRVHVDDAFCNFLPHHCYSGDSYARMIDSLQMARRHRTIPVGPVPQFKISEYRDSLGIEIGSDKSHPENIEIHEDRPNWIDELFESQRKQTFALSWITELNVKVMSEFTSQIISYLEAIRSTWFFVYLPVEDIHK